MRSSVVAVNLLMCWVVRGCIASYMQRAAAGSVGWSACSVWNNLKRR
jgi:hypothetical protein